MQIILMGIINQHIQKKKAEKQDEEMTELVQRILKLRIFQGIKKAEIDSEELKMTLTKEIRVPQKIFMKTMRVIYRAFVDKHVDTISETKQLPGVHKMVPIAAANSASAA